ncbi:MAG: response regulator, partial [Synergistaceae bacterium]|nr:response regulator [Synergistaceae bacterium]
YVNNGGNYRACCAASIVFVFFIAFPALFFLSGGYQGGMPSFFIFAVLFTVFMLDGRLALILASGEIIFYAGLCLFAYFHPEYAVPFKSEAHRLQDVTAAFATSSASLGLAMYLHFKLYRDQHRRLEAVTEEARRANSAKTVFLANMSHEIRTPLNVMLGMNEMIRMEARGGQIAEWSDEIRASGSSLKNLIDEILNISKIEAGRQEILETEYRAAELVRELSVIGESLARKRGLDFRVNADPAAPSLLYGDFAHIRQIASNFLTNAAKYTERGTVSLDVSVEDGVCGEPGAQAPCCLRVSVSDTGIGIEYENIERIFEKFSRVDALKEPSRRYAEGVGLGLAVARELTNLMGGEIEVKSDFGRGSVFTLKVPQEIRGRAPMGDWRAAEREEPGDASGDSGFAAPECRVLVVDDNPGNLRVVAEFLKRTGMRVDAAASGRECLDAALNARGGGFRYHAVLMDYMMPEMDGIEAFGKLREEIPGFDTPVIALTADAVSGERERFIGAGFADFLTKPVTRRDLEKALLKVLPEELTLRGDYDYPAGSVPPGEAAEPVIKEELDRALRGHGVSLAEGLRHASGDYPVFGQLAKIFTKRCGISRREIETLLAAGDYENLTYRFHSLKSDAGGVGATDLRNTAEKLERACRAAKEGGCPYAGLLTPVLFFEWERARDGLEKYAVPLGGGALPEKDGEDGSPPSEDNLARFISLRRRMDADREISRLVSLLDDEKDAEDIAALEEIRSAVNEIEFEEAKRLLEGYMPKQGGCGHAG